MKIITLVLLAVFAQISFSQNSHWVWQNPNPQGNNLSSVCTVDSNNVFAVGDCGIIIRSTNGGNNWSLLQFPDTNHLNSIFFANNLTGWIVGGTYTTDVILKTTNGGESWSRQDSNINGSELRAVFFNDVNNGYAVGGATYGANDFGIIIRTSDGGTNWMTVSGNFPHEFYSLCFINSYTGWAGSSGSVYKTTDGGINWNIEYSGFVGQVSSIKFVDALTGFVSKGSSYKSTNGGVDWSNINIYGLSVSFANQLTGWISGAVNPTRLFKTTDCGITWISYNMYQISNTLNAISFASAATGWAVGWYGAIQKSSNGGVNWVNQIGGTVVESVKDAFFVDANTGYVAGGTMTGLLGSILKTSNSGTSWNLQAQLPAFLNGVYFADNNTGWSCGNGYGSNFQGEIFKTTDGGSNWDMLYNMLYEDYTNMRFFDYNTGFVFGYGSISGQGQILRTTDGGNNWINYYLGAQSAIFKSYFLDVNTGWVCCSNGKVFYTTNSGTNWNSTVSSLSPDLYSIYFITQNTGWVGDNVGWIYKTTNNGNSWVNQCRSSYQVTDIKFFNESTGWAATGGGSVVYTTDGGGNWLNYPRFTYNGIDKIVFLNPDTGWMFGGQGMIVKTTDAGGIISSVKRIGQSVPVAFYVSQNYPNPFNPVTKIKFDIPPVGQRHAFDTKLIIYDVLGREVATLINRQMQPGSYSVDWNGTNYPSGVYFYKLSINNEQLAARKMVLIK